MEPPAEHPEADEIRRQVEYYFSDDNLPLDMFLKKQMLESGDGTVKLKEILHFPKMRRYKPKTAVIAALRESPFLRISDDNQHISRTAPFIWPNSDLGEDFEEKEAEWKAKHQRASQPKKPRNVVGMAAKMASGMDKPTGFEDTFVEGPITPAEFAEERQTYDPEESIPERLAIAIHRYSTRRKFHQNYALIFNAFMKYGGVEGRVRDYQGGSIQDEELKDMTPGQIAHLKSNYDVGYDKDPEEGVWELDFEGVAKGFLSSRLPFLVLPSEYPLAIRILTNFYNYLLVHDVFDPQHEAHIVAAIKACIALCNLAATELPKVHRAGLKLPGQFNVAASVLSDGFHADLWTGDENWAKENGENRCDRELWGSGDTAGMPTLKAKIVLSLGIAAYGDEMLFNALEALEGSLNCLEEREYVGLEVRDVIFADEVTRELYDGDEKTRKKVEAKRLGRLICEDWVMPSFNTWDLPLHGADDAAGPTRYEFWVEDEILGFLFPGMKLEATLRKLALGSGKDAPSFWTIDTGCRTYCSFYTYLPNELMTKEPRPVRWLIEGQGEDYQARETVEEDDSI